MHWQLAGSGLTTSDLGGTVVWACSYQLPRGSSPEQEAFWLALAFIWASLGVSSAWEPSSPLASGLDSHLLTQGGLQACNSHPRSALELPRPITILFTHR